MIGRALGVGVRVAGHIVGQFLSGPAHSAAAPQMHQTIPVAGSAEPNQADQAAARATNQAGQFLGQAGQTVSQTSRSVSRGLGGFLRPFRRVGGILWLEVTGFFFLIFVPVFIWRGVWPARASYAYGPDHWRFLVFTVLALVFLYLGVSSFWRANRRSRRP